jgi:hypothetical protein
MYTAPNYQFLAYSAAMEGRKAETIAAADSVYREDLRQNPANGWSLYGLSAALKAQGKTAESIRVTRQFADAWKRSDITLAASAF